MSAPVGLAALTLRLPLVLSEADSHLGLSNRLLARFARRVCLRLPDPRPRGAPLPRHRPPGPGRRRHAGPRGRPAALRRPGGRPAACWCSAARSARARSTWRRRRRFAAAPFHVIHISGSRDYPELAGRSLPDTYHLLRVPRPRAVRRRARRLRSGGRAGRRVGVRARRPRAAGDPRPVPPRRGRPPERQRPLDGRAGAAVTVADAELTACLAVADGGGTARRASGGWPRWPRRRPLAGAPRRRPGGGRRAAGGGRTMSGGAGGAGPQPWAGRRDPPRRRRRRRHERIRARGPRARASVTGSDADEAALPGGACAPTACSTRRRPRGREPSRRRRRRAVLLDRRSRPRTPSGRPRGSGGSRSGPAPRLLGELTGLRRTIAVAGTHGKTTTAAMTVHALRGGGLEPGWLIGATIGGGPAERRTGARASGWWSRPTSPTARCSSWRSRSALLTNVELDHHASFASLAELREVFRALPRGARDGGRVGPARAARAARRGPRRRPTTRARSMLDAGGSRFRWREHDVASRSPASTTRSTPPGRSSCVRLSRAPRRVGRSPRWPASPAPDVAFSGSGRAPAGRSSTTTTPTTRARSRPRCRARARSSTAAWWRSSSRTSTRARGRSPGSSARALAHADVVAVLDVYAARERAADLPGVSGLLVADAAADAAAGRPVYWLPDRDAARARARSGCCARATCAW